MSILTRIFSISYDEWRGSFDGRPSMFIKRLVTWRGRCVDLHKFVRADDPGCFHTHPATAIRIVLWGGYEEEIEGGERVMWKPGRFGVVRPQLSHRISRLRGRASYSLWLRGRKTNAIFTSGDCR